MWFQTFVQQCKRYKFFSIYKSENVLTTSATYLTYILVEQESSVCALSPWPIGGKISWLGGQTRNPNQCGTPYFWKPVGTAETPFNYTNWHPGLPNCIWGQQSCALIASGPEFNYRWEDIECDSLLCSVCEFWRKSKKTLYSSFSGVRFTTRNWKEKQLVPIAYESFNCLFPIN